MSWAVDENALEGPDGDLRLTDLGPGDEAIVRDVDATGPLGRRLLDLGITPGTRIRVVRRAPLGDPVQFELLGYRLCLRRSEASRVVVRRPS